MNSVRFRKNLGEESCRRKRALRRGLILFWFAGFLLLAGMAQPCAAADPTPQPSPAPELRAPPPAPPVQFRTPPKTSSVRQPLVAPTLYSIGNPTDEEQLYLEFINRARAAPQAESLLLKNTTDPLVLSAYMGFSVDLNLMVTQFSTISPQPPLSMNAKLLASARLHSQDMFDHQFQGHTDSSGTGTPGARMSAQGYNWTNSGENVYAYAQSVFHGHAGFEVDWGGDPVTQGGMQTPPGHRNSIHDLFFQEVGIGVVDGINGSVGPQIVTQDFGTELNPSAFITGVAYYDFNQNGFYDVGEGIGGVTVKVAGENFYAVTSESGGYSVPVLNGNFVVTFTASDLSNQVAAVVSGGNSVKKDFRPAYTPPVVSGLPLVGVGQAGAFSFSPVGAATSYQWKQNRRVAFTSVEGAESGLTPSVTVTASPGYPVLTNNVKNSGSFSFHLAHAQPVAQLLSLNRLLRPSSTSQLIFASRLGWATSDQVARAQVSTNSGVSWQDVWSQAGVNGSPGQALFAVQAVSLSAFADQEVLVRFVYDVGENGYFNQTDTGFGLYLDDIAVSNAEELLDPVVTDIPTGTAFNFTPASAGDYSLRVRAKVLNRILPFGPAKLITASPVQITKVQTISGGSQAQIDFTLASGTARPFQLLTAPAVTGPWTTNSAAVLTTITLNSLYRFTAATSGASQRYYRIQMSP